MNFKRIAALLVALLLVLIAMIPVMRADVIFEPYGDKFYESHREECVYIDKVYIVSGQVYGYEKPGSDKAMLSASEGTKLWMSHKYVDENGVEWGVYDNNDGTSCWFRLDELTPQYDNRDFMQEHADELGSYDGSLADFFEAPVDFQMWAYPHSESGFMMHAADYDPEYAYVSGAYIDAAGNDWLYLPYLYGSEGWLYLPDPARTEPVPDDAPEAQPTAEPTAQPTADPTAQPEPTLEPTPESVDEVVSTSTNMSRLLLVVAIVAVLGVMGFSAILIVVLFVLLKKKK